ncbi:MAG TPA: D-hexose-6-phosphate mutarotase [Candidatus Saccharimonadales bacterium]|nr:D-hexose-6-phosphate mutarotase [Candidatus Saccharimonadales bacterium]
MEQQALQRMEIPGRVSAKIGQGGLPKLEIATDWSTGEVYIQGAHITAFQKRGEQPLLFLSGSSRFEKGQAIRGGVPIIFPWFGPKEGKAAHGFARTGDWVLHETTATPDGGVSLRFHLAVAAPDWPAHSLVFVATFTDRLRMDLITTNLSNAPMTFENCLHTYLHVGDIANVSVRGLKGLEYLDKTESGARKREPENSLKPSSETDRVFVNTGETIEVQDTRLNRTILVEKSGSASTVVWNPWIAKAKAMPDFGDEEYKRMVCVESGNVADNQLTLKPGKSQILTAVLSSLPF